MTKPKTKATNKTTTKKLASKRPKAAAKQKLETIAATLETTTASGPPKQKALMLRSCDANLQAHGGFQWPSSGYVAAPDWDPKPECGNGLHGFLWGEGDGSLANFDPTAKWLVVEVDVDTIVDLGRKVKVPNGNVVFCGDRLGATAYLVERAPGKAIVGATVTAGYRGIATAGYRGIATAGYRGIATAGYGGIATAGYGGIATAGDRGIATAGYGGIATAGYGGTATAGEYAEIRIRYYDQKANRYRVAVGYVGEDGIEPNTAYIVGDDFKLRKKG